MITVKGQPALYRSFLKHGIGNHLFEIIHELPCDVNKTALDDYECLYIDQYKECGVKMLNLKGGGSNGMHCQETKDKISTIKKAQNFKHSDEAKLKIKAKRALQVVKRGFKKTKPCWNKGLKIGNKCRKAGFVVSEEAKQKLRTANLGKKHSDETKKKVSDNNARYWKGKTMSEEHRRKLSESHKGKKLSEEVRKNMSLAQLGKKRAA
jgi:Ni/Co efflux regulator RcnB